jgi:hypothetical protein
MAFGAGLGRPTRFRNAPDDLNRVTEGQGDEELGVVPDLNDDGVRLERAFHRPTNAGRGREFGFLDPARWHW